MVGEEEEDWRGVEWTKVELGGLLWYEEGLRLISPSSISPSSNGREGVGWVFNSITSDCISSLFKEWVWEREGEVEELVVLEEEEEVEKVEEDEELLKIWGFSSSVWSKASDLPLPFFPFPFRISAFQTFVSNIRSNVLRMKADAWDLLFFDERDESEGEEEGEEEVEEEEEEEEDEEEGDEEGRGSEEEEGWAGGGEGEE